MIGVSSSIEMKSDILIIGNFRVHWKYLGTRGPDQDGAFRGCGPFRFHRFSSRGFIKAGQYQINLGNLFKVQLEYIGRPDICINMNLFLLTTTEANVGGPRLPRIVLVRS
jgi:hypothetical protein